LLERNINSLCELVSVAQVRRRMHSGGEAKQQAACALCQPAHPVSPEGAKSLGKK